ncbi:MAG: metallophosphoesterase family protein [Devosia sp.]
MALSVPPDTRIYAVGDIHGEIDLLHQLMAAIDADVSERPHDNVLEVFLGDYVDRGPQSQGVIEAMMAPPAQGRRRICLKGNHEAAFLDAMTDPHQMMLWRSFGGDATMRSYGVDPERVGHDPGILQRALGAAVPADHVHFLMTLPVLHQEEGMIFVHAGLVPGQPLDAQREEDLMWIRHEFLDYDGPLPGHVVHGHTPVKRPDHRKWRTNVDTGATFTGVLTAGVFEADTVRFLST